MTVSGQPMAKPRISAFFSHNKLDSQICLHTGLIADQIALDVTVIIYFDMVDRISGINFLVAYLSCTK